MTFFVFFFGRGLRGFLRCFTGGGLKKAGYQAARGFLLPPVFRQTCVISASFQLYRCQYHFICELKSVSRSFLARDLCVCLKIWGISQNIQQFCFLNYSNYGMGFHDFAPWEISFPLKKHGAPSGLERPARRPSECSAENASALGSAYSCATDLSSAVR